MEFFIFNFEGHSNKGVFINCGLFDRKHTSSPNLFGGSSDEKEKCLWVPMERKKSGSQIFRQRQAFFHSWGTNSP